MAHDLSKLAGNADVFPILRRWDFFNHAGVSPLPAPAANAMATVARQSTEEAYLGGRWYRDIESLRESAARLLNAGRDEIAFVKNTSEGLATVANGIDFKPGDRIVTTGVEYPANMYPWMDVARRTGAELVAVAERPADDQSPAHVPLEAILDAATHPRTRLITISHVQFGSGQRMDLAAIGAFCRGRDIRFCVDAIQSLGAIPVDVKAMGIDFLSADGHKWMLGPEGAGIFYCRRELLATFRPLIVGWMNVEQDQDFDHYNPRLKPDARRFECGSHNVAGLLALRASLDLLLSAGVDAIAGRIKLLTDRLCEGLRRKSCRIASPRQGDLWSGIVSFVAPGLDHPDVVRKLRREHHIEVALRGGRLRASPHFYNTEAQIDRLIESLPRP